MFALSNQSPEKKAAQGLPARIVAPDDKQLTGVNPRWQSLALQSAGIQAKLTVGQPDDPFEQEADRVADHVMRTENPEPHSVKVSSSSSNALKPSRKTGGRDDDAEGKIQRREQLAVAQNPVSAHRAPLTGAGRPLDSATRNFFEPRFGRDFSNVRVHTEETAAQSARSFNARAYTLHQDIVFDRGQYAPDRLEGRRLLAHELAHVVQQGSAGKPDRDRRAGGSGALGRNGGAADESPTTSLAAPRVAHHNATQTIQRYIALTTPAAGRHLMLGPERATFIAAHIAAADRPLARRVLDDMATAGDEFDFADEHELQLELVKRVATSEIMQESQIGPGRNAFGYPFNAPAHLYGPRVNYAARTFWTPLPPDGYANRSRDARAATARRTARGSRYTVFGDMGGIYEWSLTPAGIADFNQALQQLFVPQSEVYKRSLMHCDYLVSLVHFRSLATAIGATRFNAAARAYGANNLKLRWNLYHSLYADNFNTFRWWVSVAADPARAPAAALGSLAEVVPSSIADLVIGDHVFFWNHQAYDTLNAGVGNAWRLENAILIDRRHGNDLFLGHGSGTKTERQMREKLAQEYDEVVEIALGLVRRIEHGSTTARTQARAELSRRFPHVEEHGSLWWIREGGIWQRLSRITATEVPGLHDPMNPSRMYPVQRPAESRR